MKKALLLAVALMMAGFGDVEAQKNLDELVLQNDVYMGYGLIRRNTLRPYTGDVIQVNENNRVFLRASLRNGRWHGEHQSFMVMRDDGYLQSPSKGRYDNGRKCGTWTERPSEDFEVLHMCTIEGNFDPTLILNCATRESEDEQVEYGPC